ncbi:hypothetical protein BDV93DRAFT_560563 [Ceratobasidium sp. AG-I]|nr:hypothetical protein BDV93DRAFT_560563 [Ceratobasidium sp. AG-I]
MLVLVLATRSAGIAGIFARKRGYSFMRDARLTSLVQLPPAQEPPATYLTPLGHTSPSINPGNDQPTWHSRGQAHYALPVDANQGLTWVYDSVPAPEITPQEYYGQSASDLLAGHLIASSSGHLGDPPLVAELAHCSSSTVPVSQQALDGDMQLPPSYALPEQSLTEPAPIMASNTRSQASSRNPHVPTKNSFNGELSGWQHTKSYEKWENDLIFDFIIGPAALQQRLAIAMGTIKSARVKSVLAQEWHTLADVVFGGNRAAAALAVQWWKLVEMYETFLALNALPSNINPGLPLVQ